MATDKRPLSPFMIGPYYKPQLTSMLSITHRATGAALTVGSLLVVYWLVSLASGEEAFQHAHAILGSMLGQLLLFLWTWALFYHMFNGIRHLFWDAGYGLEIGVTYQSGRAVVIASVVCTFLTWIIAAP